MFHCFEFTTNSKVIAYTLHNEEIQSSNEINWSRIVFFLLSLKFSVLRVCGNVLVKSMLIPLHLYNLWSRGRGSKVPRNLGGGLRLCSKLLPKNSAWVQFLLGTNMNLQEFAQCMVAYVWVVSCKLSTWFIAGHYMSEQPLTEHNTGLCWCGGQAPVLGQQV